MKILYSDKKVIAGLRSGDKNVINKTLGHLYENYYRMAKHIVITNSGNEDEAADVFQDALISFYENVVRQVFRGESSVKTYLYATIRNLWLARLKKNSRMTGMNEKEHALKVVTENDGGDQLEKLLKEIVSRTGENCKELLRLYYYENRSMKEIVDMMGFSNENSAKTQKYKCMQKLIRFLDKRPDLKELLLEMNKNE